MLNRGVHKMTPYAPIYQSQSVQQAPALPYILDSKSNFIFAQSVENAARIENGQIKVRDKRAPHCFDKEYLAFLSFLPWMHINRLSLSAFQLNPYWEEMCDSVGYSRYSDIDYSLVNADAIYDQFKKGFLQRRIALEYSSFAEPIAESIKFQKAVFKRCFDKHKQMNCLLVDFPCIFDNPIQQGFLSSNDELTLEKMARQWLKRLHQSTDLAQKLYDVHWRIVKSLNGVYSVQAFLYVVGNEAKFSDFILQEWKITCLSKGYRIDKRAQNLIWEVHCYFADSDTRSFWRKRIELVNEPLKIYRYESKAISYRWHTYPGNIPSK